MRTIHTKRATDVFKPLKKGDQLTAVYLYADGHASANFERRIRDAGSTVTYYKQIDNLGIACRFDGRIVFHRGSGTAWLRSMLAAGCTVLGARSPSLDHGSENTKAKGIAVGYVTAQTPFGELYVYDFPGLIGSDLCYQPDTAEAFNPDLETYGFRGANVAETLITRTIGPIQETAPRGWDSV